MSISRHRDRIKSFHHGDLRAALVKAAAAIVDRRGPGTLSLRDAARRVGVSHGAPYRHFRDREALLAVVAGEGFRMLGEALAQGAQRGAREMGVAYVAFALRHPQRFRLMFGGGLRNERHPELRAAASRAYEVLLGTFRAQPGIADPRQAAAAAWSLVHGLSHLLLDGHLAKAAAGRETADFAREVLGAIRFAAAAQRSA